MVAGDSKDTAGTGSGRKGTTATSATGTIGSVPTGKRTDVVRPGGLQKEFAGGSW